MKYLITGITGFAGPNLAKLLLKEGHEVHGIIRCPNGRTTDLLDILTMKEYNAIHFHTADLRQYYKIASICNSQKFDGIFHLAAQSHPPTSFSDPILTWEENVNSTVNLITAITGTPTRFMFCSTSEVYGDTCKDVGTLSEESKMLPSNPYGTSKAAMDLYVQERSRNGFIDGFVTRAFSHTGPRRGFNFSISSDAYQIAKIMRGEQEKILRVGNLETKRVVMDVADCVNAYYLLMSNPKSNKNVYNVCGKDVQKMGYYTDTLIKLSGLSDIEKEIDQKLYRPIDIQVQIGDCTKLKELTGWEQKYDINNTLYRLLNYWYEKLRINGRT